MIQIYHNSRCGKSRACLLFLTENNKEVAVIDYLKNPLSKSEVVGLLEKLQLAPLALIRTNEKIWIAEFKGKKLTNDQLIEAMVANPILIERPIVVKGNQAVIARPLENVNKII